MCPINPEAVEKLIAAKKLEKEAIALMLPPKVVGHLEVIFSELETMVLEILLERKESSDAEEKSDRKFSPEGKSETSSKVKKVPIE